MPDKITKEHIKIIEQALNGLTDKLVFIGGATVSLYADRPSSDPRPTDDIDIVVEVYSNYDYVKLEERLRDLGFGPDPNAGFIGRYIVKGIKVDIMPVIIEILGFDNKWYAEGFEHSINYQLDESTLIGIFSAPYFMATKLEAFKGRGKNTDNEPDGRTSEDFEDIIFILENRERIWNEIRDAPETVRKYLVNEFSRLLSNKYFPEWLSAHLSNSAPGTEAYIIERMKLLAGEI